VSDLRTILSHFVEHIQVGLPHHPQDGLDDDVSSDLRDDDGLAVHLLLRFGVFGWRRFLLRNCYGLLLNNS
jgi:hypothetical protein